jgi:hypothetical protein
MEATTDDAVQGGERGDDALPRGEGGSLAPKAVTRDYRPEAMKDRGDRTDCFPFSDQIGVILGAAQARRVVSYFPLRVDPLPVEYGQSI